MSAQYNGNITVHGNIPFYQQNGDHGSTHS